MRVELYKTYRINRNRLKYYVDKGWNDTLYNTGQTEFKVNLVEPSFWHNLSDLPCYRIEYSYDQSFSYYLPEDCFYNLDKKLNRILE